ncbi:hypothetical protein YTXLTZUM_CDS0197 [Enterococcus phage VRE9_3]
MYSLLVCECCHKCKRLQLIDARCQAKILGARMFDFFPAT